MNSKILKKEKNQITLEIKVSAEDFEKAIQEAYIKNRGRFNLPGFRKGKTPRKIIEMQYGEGVFYEDAINTVLPKEYDKAVEEHNLDPVDRPDVDIKEINKGEELTFTAIVTVKPEVTLGEYKGIEVEKKEYNVTDEDVNKDLESMRELNSRLVSVEDRPVQNDDTVIIDYNADTIYTVYDTRPSTYFWNRYLPRAWDRRSCYCYCFFKTNKWSVYFDNVI